MTPCTRSLISASDPAGPSDEVRLVDDVPGATAADADEDTLVQPGELAGGGLDLRGGSKGVLARIDVLAAAETFEDLRAAVAHATRLHVEQGTVVGLQRVADVREGGTVRQDDLPVGADARQELPFQVRPLEGAADLRDDSPAPLAHLAEIERFAKDSLEAVDQSQRRIRETVGHREASAGSFGCASSGVTVTRSQSAMGRAPSRPSSSASLSARYRPTAVDPSPTSGRLQRRTRCPSSASLAAAADSARWRRWTSSCGVPAGISSSNSTRNSITSPSSSRR